MKKIELHTVDNRANKSVKSIFHNDLDCEATDEADWQYRDKEVGIPKNPHTTE